MKKIYLLGLVSLGIVTISAWWLVKESLKDISRISEPMSEEERDATPEQLEKLKEKFKTR